MYMYIHILLDLTTGHVFETLKRSNSFLCIIVTLLINRLNIMMVMIAHLFYMIFVAVVYNVSGNLLTGTRTLRV